MTPARASMVLVLSWDHQNWIAQLGAQAGLATPTPKSLDSISPQVVRTPSEIVGLLALVTIVLFGAVTATDILQFEALTTIVRAILRIGAQVLSGMVILAVGLYLANLAFHLVDATGSSGQTRILAQAARISILVLVGAMALQQMGMAMDIVNLAFGLGGREVAGD